MGRGAGNTRGISEVQDEGLVYDLRKINALSGKGVLGLRLDLNASRSLEDTQ